MSRFDISVVLEAFLDTPLDQLLPRLRASAPELTAVEVGAGGYAPHPHLDPDAALADPATRREFLSLLDEHGFRLDALNVWGNPVHPDSVVAAEHDAALRRAIRLAGPLGTTTVVAMAGAPGAAPGDRSAVFGAGGWLPYLEGVHTRQWDDHVAPYWMELANFARRENPDVRVCIELHPGTAVYNVETFERFITLGDSLWANLDPSHFFWMGMDAYAVVERIADRIGHIHAKDVRINPQAMALNGLLDQRWPADPESLPWTFAAPGVGHDESWWRGMVERLAATPASAISIEHEDPFVDPRIGVPETAALLRRVGA